MLLIPVEVSVNVTCQSTTLKAESYLHATYPSKSICECGLSVHEIHRLKAQSYLHATYLSGSIGLLVQDSHRLKAQSYPYTTYSGGSICVSGLSVKEDTDCSTELLFLVEVFVKVACQSTTATD